VGRGGEGCVYEVANDPSLVAKIYHKLPLAADHVAKLEAMAACWSSPLETISAWPRSILFDPTHRKPCGILMTKMSGARPLHELYGTTNRRRHFPEVGWHHLVLAARNTAAAFQTLHSAGIVVGDVNQGNLLVDSQMCVRMIDCDSFQISRDGKVFNCPVGTPHFTPPELQSQKLREVVRSQNHDRFGLAVLIFHLLFVGRHPFAGRYRGPGDLSIERAIAESRFAFSRNKAATMIDPPPASLLLDDLPPGVAELFEAAFRGGAAEGASRPSPQVWVAELEMLMKRRRVCSFDQAHVYSAHLDKCPWCRIEDAGGPTFFVAAGGTSIISNDRLLRYDEKISQLKEVLFPELPLNQIDLPTMPVLKRPKELPKRTRLDAAAATLVAGGVTSLAGAVVSPWLLLAGLALSAASAGYLLSSKKSQAQRKAVVDFNDWLEKSLVGLARMSQAIERQHNQRMDAFNSSVKDLQLEVKRYRSEGAQLKEVIMQQGSELKSDFLRQHLIRDDARRIAGLTTSHVALLESFGVESANDVERLKLYGVPNIDEDLTMELLQWRQQVERGYTFNPEHGEILAELRGGGEAGGRRFKVSQARKILTGQEQLQALASARRVELTQILGQYEVATSQWLKVAKQLRDFQNGRRPLERLINHSPWSIVGAAAGMAAAAGLLYAMAGWLMWR
jgi:DNA-binding helix-hairpin-helix protein with protein kinase domain